MKRGLLLLVGILASLLANAQPNHTITIDGTNDFDATTETFTGTSGSTWYFTWDASNFYFGITAPDVSSGSATKWVYLYIDTDPKADPYSGNGDDLGVQYNTQQPFAGFNADFHFRWKADNSYTNLLDYNNGTSDWDDDNTTGGNFGIAAFQSGTFVEFSIPRSSLGNPSQIRVSGAMINEQGGGEFTFFMIPAGKNADGYGANLNSFYEFTLEDGEVPTEGHNYGYATYATATGNFSSAIWSNGKPDANAYAVVNSGRTIDQDEDATVKGLYVDAGCTYNIANSVSLNIASRGAMAVGGAINVNGNLTLQSDIDGTAYVIDNNGSVTGDVTMERYLSDNGVAGASYRYFASPFTDATVADFSAAGFSLDISRANDYNTDYSTVNATNFPNLFMYDEGRITASQTSFLKGWMVPTGTGTAFDAGKGFIANIGHTQTVSLKGTLQLGDVVVSNLGYNSNGTDGGWHLLGNPYANSIDIDQFLTDNAASLSSTSAYVRMATSQYGGNWASRTAAGVSIPASWDGNLSSMQGFFVRVNSAGAPHSLTFTQANLVNNDNTTSFFRKKQEQEKAGLLRLAINSGGKSDEAVVYFQAGASEGFDEKYDAYKVQYNPKGFPTLFTKADDAMLSINAFGDNFNELAPIALHIWLEASGEHTFRLTERSNFSSLTNVYLEDRLTGKVTELASNASYAFTANKGMVADRFFIHTSKMPAPSAFGDEMLVYAVGKTVKVAFANAAQADRAQIAIYSLAGQAVGLFSNQSGQASFSAATQLPAGIYVVQVQHGEGITAKKVVIQ